MPRYINEDEFCEYIRKNTTPSGAEWFISKIKDMPAADVAEVKHGEWQYHSNPDSHINPEDAYCSNCGFWVCTSETSNFDDYNFCPYCGANMRGETE